MIIGLGGNAGCGKDTIAGILCKKHGFKAYAFAENLKRMCMKAFNLTEDQCFTQEGKEGFFDKAVVLDMNHIVEIHNWIENVNKWPVRGHEAEEVYRLYCDDEDTVFSNPRELLQFVGTEICRKVYDQNFHIKIVQRKILSDGASKVVVSDARFPNERNAVKDWPGFTILIEGPKSENSSKTAGINGHESETSLGEASEYDVVLFNDKSLGLKILELKVEKLLESLKENIFKKHS